MPATFCTLWVNGTIQNSTYTLSSPTKTNQNKAPCRWAVFLNHPPFHLKLVVDFFHMMTWNELLNIIDDLDFTLKELPKSQFIMTFWTAL